MYEFEAQNLVSVLYNTPKRSRMPPKIVVQALETATHKSGCSAVYKYYASALRCQLGVSGRYKDVQHTAPHALQFLEQTIESKPWETKTTRKGDKNNITHVATLWSMTGVQWWTPLVTACRHFAETEPEMD